MPIKIKILCKVKTCHKNLKYPLICQLICLWGVKFLFNQYQSLWSCFLSRKSLKSVKDAFLGHPIYQFLRNLEFLNFIFIGIKLPWPSRSQKYVSICLPISIVMILLLGSWTRNESNQLTSTMFIIFHYSSHH